MINFHSNALLSPLSRLHCPSHMPVTSHDRSASRAWQLVLRITRFPLDFPTGRGSAVTPPKSSTVYMSCHVVILPFIFLHYGNPTLTYSLSFSKWLRRHYGTISPYKINARVIDFLNVNFRMTHRLHTSNSSDGTRCSKSKQGSMFGRIYSYNG